ncbi:MAG: DUF885 family protein [Verrucomicrobia bacterium]|nr:DUF885 family protein [Verrucomicrobiota bacterium]
MFFSLPVAVQPPALIAVDSSRLFNNRKNGDLYWEALVQIAKNERERAEFFVDAIRSDTPSVAFKYPWKGSHPQNVDDFFDKLFLSAVSYDPQLLTFLGLFESIGVREYNAYLTDISKEAVWRDFTESKKNLADLERYRIQDLSKSQQISYKTFLWSLRFAAEGEKFLFHAYLVNQMYGTIQDLTALFTDLHPLEVAEDVKTYASRLSQIPALFRQLIDRMKYQSENKILPPRFALEKPVETIRQFIAAPPRENIFYTRLAEKIEMIDHPSKEEALAQVEEILRNKVYPAYRMLQAYLEKTLKLNLGEKGVWALPNGEAYYANRLKYHTTTDLTADEIHAMGLREVDRIQKEMRQLFVELGIDDPGKGVGELMKTLAADPQFYYPNSEEGRKQCLSDFGAILERCRSQLWPLFDLKPKAQVVVKPVPEHEAQGAPGAYYISPSIDGTRPGIFCINLYDMKSLPKYRMETLAVHEAEPGHHFQIALQNEMNMPILRKILGYTAFAEGWALYTEKLAYEEGFYSSTYSKLGHLQDELLRASRLVLDTGIHRKRWSREKAIEYMTKATGYDRGSVVSEVERYFVYPGQACAYKIGQLKILELRQQAKDQLGDRFDIKEFHNVLLELGAVPLSILEEVVHDYIQKNR